MPQLLAECYRCKHRRAVPDNELCLGILCPRCGKGYMDAIDDRPGYAGTGGGGVGRLSGSGYNVEIGSWLGAAWRHWGGFVGPFIGFLLVLLLLDVLFALPALAI